MTRTEIRRYDALTPAQRRNLVSMTDIRESPSTFTLATLARDLDIDPKVARARARRLVARRVLVAVDPRDRRPRKPWVFDARDRRTVAALFTA